MLLKARIWEVEKKIMIYPGDSFGSGSSAYEYVIDLTGTVTYRSVYGFDSQAGQPVETLKNVVTMLYTGTNDQNDKEIYADDIIQYYKGGWKILRVVFEDACFYAAHEKDDWRYKYPLRDLSNAIVIGNFCQNPEMLVF